MCTISGGVSQILRPVDVAVIGNLLIDELPGPVIEPGGAALYLSLAAAKAGARVGLHSVVGEDYPLQQLEKAGVDFSLRRLSGAGGRTVIEYLDEGRRLTHVGPGHQVMTPQAPHPFEATKVIVAPMPWEWQLFHLDACKPGSAFLDPYPTLNETRWRTLSKRLDKLHFLVVNIEELEMDLEEIPEDVPILVKEGPKGGYHRPSGLRWEAPPVKVIDPTGAGDSFLAGVAVGAARGWPLKRCLDLGAELAARVIQQLGSRALSPDTSLESTCPPGE